MSVYTVVKRDQLITHLQHYSLGQLIDFQGISSGIENTNYFVTTTVGDYVLTLFEELKAEELPYFLKIMACVSNSGVPSARPIADNNNNFLNTLNGKPTALVEKLDGTDIEWPTIIQCEVLGKTIAQLHLATQQLELYRENSRGAVWRQQAAELLIPLIDSESAVTIRNELEFQASYNTLDIPKGIIHADLFRDNALFLGNELTGIIDFYYACNDYLIYDIAVAVNDWCIGGNGLLDSARFNAVINAYQNIRPFTKAELKCWPIIIRAAAFRFWLSRLRDVHFPKEGEMTHLKNPDAMKLILLARRNHPENYRLG
ncbi:MAG: homoserine kinase [Piscirickettsiaceae bacterium]|nr:MAG: homoserine kinase [Piscirickettsiaceae bacterium]